MLQYSSRVIVLSTVVCFAIAAISVVSRIAVRLKQKIRLDISDYLLLVATAFYVGYLVALVIMAGNPTGTFDPERFTLEIWRRTIPASFATEIFTGIIITCCKISLLSLWHKIFVPERFRKINYTVMGTAIAWYIGTTLLLFFQCNPISGAWNYNTLLEGGKCIPFGYLIAGYEAGNIFVDILIITLPISQIRKLQMSPHRKGGLICVLLLGGLVIVTSVVRIYYNNADASSFAGRSGLGNYVLIYLWTNIQLGATVVCASLPVLLPLFLRQTTIIFTPVRELLLSSLKSGTALIPRLAESDTAGNSDTEVARHPSANTAEVALDPTDKGLSVERQQCL